MTKPFNIRLGKMGIKTCITVDFGDGSKMKFFGNPVSCKARYQSLTDADVGFVDPVLKSFDISHIFEVYPLFETLLYQLFSLYVGTRTLQGDGDRF